MKVLSIDPSITHTGAAFVESHSGNKTTVLEMWSITPDGNSIGQRVASLAKQYSELISRQQPCVVLIEMPFATPRGGPHSTRSTLTLPTYGMAVGAAIAAAAAYTGSAKVHYLAVDKWCKSYPPTKNDPHKTKRVAFAEMLFQTQIKLPVSKAGDVADSLLMADYYLRLVQVYESAESLAAELDRAGGRVKKS